MDYRAAARFRATKLTDLIAEEMLAGGEGFFKSAKKAISAKTKARLTGIKQIFDPLNLASALVGRSRLGTTLIGKMFGRSAEDITYFAGDRGRKARPIRKFRYKNPLIISVSSADTTPVKRNDSLANIFGKIYNTLLKNREEQKRLKEIQNNFKEELSEEDERRHKELIDAILNRKNGTMAIEDEDKKKKSIFDTIKDIMKTIKEYGAMFVDLSRAITKALVRTGVKTARAIGSLGSSVLRFVGRGSVARGAGLLGLLITTVEAGRFIYNKVDIGRAAEKGDISNLREMIAHDVTDGDMVELPEDTKEIDKKVIIELQNARLYGSKEADSLLQEIEKKGIVPTSPNQTPDLELMKDASKEEAPVRSAGKPGVRGSFGSPQRKKSKSYKLSEYDTESSYTPTSISTPSSAIPTSPKVSPLASASMENANLKLNEQTNAGSSSPFVMNTNNVAALPKPSNRGIPQAVARVRDDELETPLVDNLRRVSYA